MSFLGSCSDPTPAPRNLRWVVAGDLIGEGHGLGDGCWVNLPVISVTLFMLPFSGFSGLLKGLMFSRTGEPGNQGGWRL